VKYQTKSLIYTSKNSLCVTIRENFIFEVSLLVSGIKMDFSQYKLCVLMHIKSSHKL